MKKPVNPELNRQILDEASEWFVDFRVGDVDAEARARFDEWLRRSPEHIRAYWEIAKTYVELPAQPSLSSHKVDQLIAYARSDPSDKVIHLNFASRPTESHPPTAMRAEGDNPRKARPQLPRQRRFLAAAAVACALTIVAALWWQTRRHPLYATDIGERRSITLADGSTVDLNARSKLRIEFSSNERRVELLEGQALFQVSKDKHRAFLVQSGDALVRAVGTQFDVYRKDSGTTVTVLEGRVAVYSTARSELPAVQSNTTSNRTNIGANAAQQHYRPRASTKDSSSWSVSRNSSDSNAQVDAAISNAGLADPSGAGAVLLSAGEQVTVTPDATGTPVPQHADLNAATAWMQRKLIFEGSKLSDVVGEFNRYNRQQLVIDDRGLADFQISGVYSSTDPSSLLRFLQDQGFRITTRDNEVRIDAH
jgi:transmembrane sensor